MEIKTLLQQSITDRFKADCVVKKLEENIREIAEKKHLRNTKKKNSWLTD